MAQEFTPTLREAQADCPCCGYRTLTERHRWEICDLCDWEDECSEPFDPDKPSGANHGFTLREAQANFVDHLNMYPLGWDDRDDSPEVIAAKRQVIGGLQAIRDQDASGNEELWRIVTDGERQLYEGLQRRIRAIGERVRRDRKSF